MLSERIFQITLLISLATHTVILSQNPNFAIFPTNKKEQNLEISYVRAPIETKEVPVPVKTRKEPLRRSLSAKISAQKTTPPPYIDKENIFKKNKQIISREPIFSKPAVVRSDIISVKKIITLPPVDMDKINNPSYISYYQIVREKIRRAAYQNYSRADVGEVYLSFAISKEGYLAGMRLVEEKSSFSPYLRNIAVKSIKDASPFPSFPKDLDYPQLSFNVVISFEIE